MTLSFKPWHGMPYKKFNIFADVKNRKKRIGRMLAPNEDLALIKARENLPDHRNLRVEARRRRVKT